MQIKLDMYDLKTAITAYLKNQYGCDTLKIDLSIIGGFSVDVQEPEWVDNPELYGKEKTKHIDKNFLFDDSGELSCYVSGLSKSMEEANE